MHFVLSRIRNAWSPKCAHILRHLLHRDGLRPGAISLRPPILNTDIGNRCFALPSHWGAKKGHRSIQIQLEATSEEQEARLELLRNSIKSQADHVRKLKSELAADSEQVREAIGELKSRKQDLQSLELELATTFDRFKLEDLLRRRFFYDQSFSIFGGVSGQYDFGPMGCALMSNILHTWRQQFVREERMLEVECSTLTPEPVLQSSGHLERFVDWMVRDQQTGECFRVDHLLKQWFGELSASSTDTQVKEMCASTIGHLENMGAAEMYQLIVQHGIRSPNSGAELSEPVPFNLMFETEVGERKQRRFLRPETAQGVFVNYDRLAASAGGQLPFAVAQIGNAFRNEIAPRSGLLRVREFTMAEIEHFCDAESRAHPKFGAVDGVEVQLWSACDQMEARKSAKQTVGEAVGSGLIANETLGYYLARIQQFLLSVGIRPDRLRFRQHCSNEMAHYASDCWDAEILTSYGWIECVGCADRSAYDLTQHNRATGQTAQLVPNVVEPSFGIGRILYACLEHSFNMRAGDDQRCYLSLAPAIAPFKCSILPLSNNIEGLAAVVETIGDSLTAHGIAFKEDSSSGSIGRRYARTDEIGIPYAVTIDYETVQTDPPAVTLRERDSMSQVRLPISAVAGVVAQLTTGQINWPEVERIASGFDGGKLAAQPILDKECVPSNLQSNPSKNEFIYNQSFSMYGNHHVGQVDLGPIGCSLKNHILNTWQAHFVLRDRMLQMKCSILTPEQVVNALKSNESPATNDNELLATSIGPSGTAKAFLRPDCAVGILANFKRLLEFNAGKLPFAAAQVGQVFRNESAPSDDLQRNYEFTAAEIVYFSDPRNRRHPRFDGVRQTQLSMLAIGCGRAEVKSIGDWLKSGLVTSEALGYHLVRIAEFLQSFGIRSDRIRFRQRAFAENSNPATDCWDAEIETNNDWMKCVRCSDRSTHDLHQLTLASGVKLTAELPLAVPQAIEALEAVPNKSALKSAYKKDAKRICELLADLEEEQLLQLKNAIEAKRSYPVGNAELNGKMVAVKVVQKTVQVEEVVPNVISVSFGIGRIMEVLLK